MVSDSSTNNRLDNVERAVGQLSDRVGDIAKFMERLVTIEERNSFMTQKHDELKVTLKESVDALSQKHEKIEQKVTALQEKMIWMMAVYSVLTAVAAVVAPYVVKAFMSMGAPS